MPSFLVSSLLIFNFILIKAEPIIQFKTILNSLSFPFRATRNSLRRRDLQINGKYYLFHILVKTWNEDTFNPAYKDHECLLTLGGNLTFHCTITDGILRRLPK